MSDNPPQTPLRAGAASSSAVAHRTPVSDNPAKPYIELSEDSDDDPQEVDEAAFTPSKKTQSKFTPSFSFLFKVFPFLFIFVQCRLVRTQANSCLL